MRLCTLIPAKDERLGIGKTILSVINAGVLLADIYVVDDGSSDGTWDIARAYDVQVLRNENNIGKAKSIERATRHFRLTERYDVISLMDADTAVNADYYREVRKAFTSRISPWKLRLAKSRMGRFLLWGFGINYQTSKIAAVCGQAKSNTYNGITAYRAVAYCLGQFVFKGGQAAMGVITVAPGCAASYAADVFAQLEWTRDTIVEDMDVTIQIHRKGLGRIVYAPKARVFTQDPRTFRDYARQMFRWQTGNWQVGKKHNLLGWSFKRIDWEYKFIMLEGLLFSTFLFVSTLWYIAGAKPKELGYAFLANLIWMGLQALICAIVERRPDILVYAPLFPFLGYMDCAIFVYSFWRTVVRGEQIHSWNAVRRY